MVGLAVRFDLGCYHATEWWANVNEATVEWPPSPWRLLRALYAASAQHVGLEAMRTDLRRALEELARASPPTFELPAAHAAHTRHYVPLPGYGPFDQDKTSLLLDAFNAVDPEAELLAWWAVELDVDARSALTAAAAAVGYLGRSESVCTMRLAEPEERGVTSAIPATDAADLGWEHAERVELLTVDPSSDDPLAVLTLSVSEMRKQRLRTPPDTQRVAYAVRAVPEPGQDPEADQQAAPTLAILRAVGGDRPPLTEAVTVGHLLRSALQRRFDPGRQGVKSRVLSGHDGDGPRRDQHAHAHFLALPGRDERRIDRLAIWAPEGLGPDEVEAIGGLRQLRMREMPEPFRVGLVALGGQETLELPTLLGPAERWKSLTPFALPRHQKRRDGRTVETPEEQVVRELELRGLPRPNGVELIPGSWLCFVRTRPGVSRNRAAPTVGVRLTFPTPVRGPVALGRLSHFGLGLFAPDEP